MRKHTKNKGVIPIRSLKRSVCLDAVKMANSIARCNDTRYARSFIQGTSAHNPAMKASEYPSIDDFRHDYLLYNIIRKYDPQDSNTAERRREAAFVKFMEVEQTMSDVNSDLSWTRLALKEPEAHRILWRASRKISRLLGQIDVDKLLSGSAFSHGASALLSRKEGRADYKFLNEEPEVTLNFAELAMKIIAASPLWSGVVQSVRVVKGNRLTTVPKDADIDRVIACEPMLNMFFQKGIGTYMRNRLKRVNIDLDDQTVNQSLARSGSLHGHLATVDLSAASDSVSLAVCKLLLPGEWYELLLTCRSDYGYLPNGKIISYEKMSSMGNGFTFELESLLFWAITQSCEDSISERDRLSNRSDDYMTHRCSVYGDDIICRTQTYQLLVSVLNLCGFKINDDKSFYDGPFRESCGKHYFQGVDVSPFFIRRPVNSIVELIGFLNRLRRWNRSVLDIDDPRYTPVYDAYVEFLPSYWQKPRIPDGLGDGALYGCLAEVLPTFNRNGVYYTDIIVNGSRRLRQDDDPDKYRHHADRQVGLGAYLVWLNLCRQDEYINVYGVVVRCVKQNYDAEPLDTPPGVVVSPGDVFLRRVRVKLHEWRDHF